MNDEKDIKTPEELTGNETDNELSSGKDPDEE